MNNYPTTIVVDASGEGDVWLAPPEHPKAVAVENAVREALSGVPHTCQHCKHWDTSISDGELGICRLITDMESKKAFIIDMGALETTPDFGCNLWEETK
jgi:hypothetical protein